MNSLNIIIPMAGEGTRFPPDRYLPKPLIDVNGKPMIVRAIESLGMPDHARWHFIIRTNDYSETVKESINSLVKNSKFIEVTETTQGPACSALLFRDEINNDQELIVANCDQIMEWNSDLFFHNSRLYDGCIVTYYSDTDKNSYAKLDKSGRVVEIREKEVISNISLNGIHYWKQGRYFVSSAQDMIAADDRAPNGEFYIAPTYNYMIKQGLTVGIFHIPNEQHHAVGVPIDLEKFLKYEKA
jgi:UDP-N-acetylglucosamine diphosphorylase / glucose-1-phosphate thymidylyltransferase / UDP-N-acetylgalactosamine diphosphorylase / glucosamine-1-phosphate N-acetyltransferase / galactosamine-1-phosphate N-acetyltransferase